VLADDLLGLVPLPQSPRREPIVALSVFVHKPFATQASLPEGIVELVSVWPLESVAPFEGWYSQLVHDFGPQGCQSR
jgi:hypothetical protein